MPADQADDTPCDVLPADPQHLSRAMGRLARGQVIVVPTDTVNGLVALAKNPAAVSLLYRIKQRPHSMPLQVLTASTREAEQWVNLPDYAKMMAKERWPGALTLVAPASEKAQQELPHLISPQGALGVRVPSHPFVVALIQSVGAPLAASSANRSGEPPAHSLEELLRQLGSGSPRPSLILDGGKVGKQASQVVDCTGSAPRVLRAG